MVKVILIIARRNRHAGVAMVLHNDFTSLLKIACLSLLLPFEIEAQQLKQLVNNKSDRFLFKLYGIENTASLLPLELQNLIAQNVIPSVFSPHLAEDLVKKISVPDAPATHRNLFFIAITDDGSHIAVADGEKLLIFEAESGKCISQYTFGEQIVGVCFNREGTKLAIITHDNSNNAVIKILKLNHYQLDSSSFGEEIEVDNGSGPEISFINQDKILIVTGYKSNSDRFVGAINHYDPKEKKLSRTVAGIGEEGVLIFRPIEGRSSIAFLYALNQNNSSIAFISYVKGMEIYDSETQKVTTILSPEEMVKFEDGREMIFKDNRLAFRSNHDKHKSIVLFDVASKKTKLLFEKEIEAFLPLSFGPTGFMYGRFKKTILLYNTEIEKCIALIPATLSGDWECASSPNGRHFALVSLGTIYLWPWTPLINDLEDLLTGKVNLEQLLFIKFLYDLKNAGYVLTKEKMNAEDEALLSPKKRRLINLAAQDMHQLKEVFSTFNGGIQEYLTKKYFLLFK